MNLDQSLSKVRDYISSGDLDAAQLLTNKMLTKKNIHPDVLFLSACVEFMQGDYSRSIRLFKNVLRKQDGNTIARLNLAIALNETNRPSEAITHFEKVIEKQPDNYQVFYNLGNSYHKLERYQEAKRAYLQAVSLNPECDLAFNNLGVVCKRLDQKEEAIKYFNESIRLNPSSTPYVNLIALLSKENSPQAYTHAMEAVRLDDAGDALMYAYSIFINACGWNDAAPIRSKMLNHAKTSRVNTGVLQDLLLTLNCDPEVDVQDIFELHQRWGKEIATSIAPYKVHNKELAPGKKLRIGYLSPDFNDHSVGLFIRNIITAHDYDNFEIHCYSKAKIEDAVTAGIRKCANNFINVSKLSNEQLAAKIHGDGVHILVDLAGHTTETAIAILAYKPAPVQISYLGYPNTSGLDAVDYRITDNFADIEGGTWYTEKLIKMPESFLCFGNFETRSFDFNPPALNTGYITFGSFNHVRKLTPEVIRVWSSILEQVPQSRLVVKGGRARWESVKQNIINEFKKNKIDESRIELHSHIEEKGGHLDFYNKIDIALDTFPYNGTTTTCEALWMGVPVVTLAGKVHAQRVSYSILRNIGVEDTIAHTGEEYIGLAVKYATDMESLAKLRKKIPAALRQSVLCNPQQFTRQLENIFYTVWAEKEKQLLKVAVEPDTESDSSDNTSMSNHHADLILDAVKLDIERGNFDIAHEKLLVIDDQLPDNLNARFLLGTVKHQLGQFDESLEILSSVLQRNPENVSVLLNLGATFQETGKQQQAIDSYKKILRKEPGHYLALNNLANIYKKIEGYDEAQKLLEASIASNDRYWVSSFNLGSVYAAKNDHANAIKWFNNAIELEKSPLAYAALIISLGKRNEITQAYDVAKEVLLLSDPGIALIPAWNVFAHMCDWQNLQKVQPRVLEILQSGTIDNTIRQTALLGLNAKPDIDPILIYKIHKLWGEHQERISIPGYQYKGTPQLPAKIRIGYLSGDFNRHSVGFFIRNNIISHDANTYEVYCYSNTKTEDEVTARIKKAAKKYTDINKFTTEEIARIIHDDGIHILIDLAGHTRGTQVSALCYRPAPIQITYLGYPNTTGLSAVDFRITDPHAETQNGTRYTEQLLFMPESFLCFGKFSDLPINKTLPVISNGFITFGSFNNVTKVTPKVIQVWSEILAGVSNSRLIIKAERANIDTVQKNISKEFSKYEINNDRIEFHGFTENTESHLAFYNQIDIALDTFPYTGTTTTCESLWMGVPVITLAGRLHAQRVSYSILKNIGIEDTITHNDNEYVERAVSLANDIHYLQILHEKIPTAIRNSILCKPETFTRQFEQLLLKAWELKINGADAAGINLYSYQSKGDDIMNLDENLEKKILGPQMAPTASGIWTDHILRFPYAVALSPAWMKYIEAHMDEESWKYHQIALTAYRDACNSELSLNEVEAHLRHGYEVLFQLVNIKGNASNLQTFSRIAVELGEYGNALFALHYIASIFENQHEVSLAEPFLCVAKKFENMDLDENIGSWAYAAVIYQIENIERVLSKTTQQSTRDRLEKFKKTGFLDSEMQTWWQTAEFNTNRTRVRKLHIGGKQTHPDWEIINALPGANVDHIGNAKDLSQFPDNCFGEIYGSHVLEHFDYQNELGNVLKEWLRVLTPGGKLYISVPDLDKLAALFINKRQLNFDQRFHIMRMIFGGQIDEYDYHKVGLNREILEVYLKQAGFEHVSVVDSFGIFADTSDYKPYDVAISVNVTAQKPAIKQILPMKI